jgi:hypothetical protein
MDSLVVNRSGRKIRLAPIRQGQVAGLSIALQLRRGERSISHSCRSGSHFADLFRWPASSRARDQRIHRILDLAQSFPDSELTFPDTAA